MVTIILSIALLVALIGLGIEIGIASFNIRRANRYRFKESIERHNSERAEAAKKSAEQRLASLDDFATKISWLLNFLYKRYDRFGDLEKEIEEGMKTLPEDAPAPTTVELDDKFEDLKKAMNIIRVTVRAADRVETLVESIASQVERIAEDFRECDKPASPAEDKNHDRFEDNIPEPTPAESETSESAPAESVE